MADAPYVQRLRGYDVFEAGHRVRRLLPSPKTSMVGPFVLFDHFGPATLAPGEGIDIARHGHAHLAAVTYFFAGSTHHTDDLGHDVVVEPGDVAWMHAGAGIVHAERTPDAFRRRGGVGHGIQAWVALPEAHERSAPRFQLARRDTIPEITRGEVTLRVLVGEAFGARSPIETCSEVALVVARTGARPGEVTIEPAAGRRAVWFAEGYGSLDGHRVGVGTMLVLRDGAAPILRLEADTIALVLGGEPLGTRLMQGNVIASSEDRLERALRELP
ncbi:MAG: pirin family protein [Sandaracinaceae bacterium]|nr:pirin family protein [Sandaracinaceae bacterium]